MERDVYEHTRHLALEHCASCEGKGRTAAENVCNCVLRTIFRRCWAEYRHLQFDASHVVQRQYEHVSFTKGRRGYGIKSREFCADFELVARRVLSGLEREIFEAHYLRGWQWRQCCDAIGTDKGKFFHGVYRVERNLGRAFAELRPYPLFPVAEYFATVTDPHRTLPMKSQQSRGNRCGRTDSVVIWPELKAAA